MAKKESQTTQPCIILSNRPWNKELATRLSKRLGLDFVLFNDDSEGLYSRLSSKEPAWIFVPHWSKKIDLEIWKRWKVVIFHMTDLPFGRGGSPLQNLIIRGFSETKMSAIQCSEAMDKGPVYMKSKLSLHGSAEEIYIRADNVIEEMIVELIQTDPSPVPQHGIS